MASFLEEIKDVLNSGDPEVRTWFLIRHNYLPFILCGSYVLFTTIIGPAFMKNRKPYDLRKAMIFFNFFVVVVYTICLIIAFWKLPTLPMQEFCKGSETIRKGDIRYTLATAGWAIYILKYLEFLDTVFFVLRKKQNQITFLHVMHHTIVPIIGWIIGRSATSGVQYIPVIINSIVHVIMYLYYALAAMGPEVRKYLWWKKYLTQLQMIQFLLFILFVTVVIPLTGCTMLVSSFAVYLFAGAVFLYLFYDFYKRSFQSSRKSPSTYKDADKNR